MSHFLVNDGPTLDEHLLLVHKIAWEVYLQTGYDPSDLYSEGCLQYLEKRLCFNPAEKAKFTTFIWTAVRNSLLDYTRKKAQTVLCAEEDWHSLILKKHQAVDRFAMGAF